MANEIPDISVIIPLYNVEKYIAEALNSLLVQTFQNFEVIVVDDCSTDHSAEIVEKYLERGGGQKFKLVRMRKNSGNPGIPRNRGLEFSRGKYIFFMDSDDVISQTALAEMHTLAEKFLADVIYFSNYGLSSGTGKFFMQNIKVTDRKFVTTPQFLPYDLNLRLDCYLKFMFEAPPWLKLVRRDFLLENEIKFPLNSKEDNLWTLELLCLAEKFLITPNPCYVHRIRENSDSFAKKNLDSQINYAMDSTIRGTKNLNDFMNQLKFFYEHPELRYKLFNFYATIDFLAIARSSPDTPPHRIYETIKNKFGDYLGEHAELVSYLATNNVTLLKNLTKSQ